MPKTKTINLLPQEEFDVSTLGRILKWAMGTFRIIVIVTEMIVMTAFLSRFWLDAQNSDLNDAIAIKTAQISAQSDFEKQFRILQHKLSIFKTLTDSPQASIAKLLNGMKNEKSLKTVDLGSLSTSENDAAFTVFSVNIGY
ncbi:MAG: hypothetical protein UU12_C0039G0005 [Candidatus Woesebacteria bacterium GW2011_GWA2_40_7b]|uniref:Uncharacterized protein n=1 Tax=Candidatus Woesebacteria bacterium GW2011_GWA2_40_7b TaxID=1618563 RepID=A0A0G0SY02_9BACT|nr:MAG: hypothetical protein UU12_C0039G0005 [Candidatus Woesebacteria bacterium GW2011_GWA2_40_7b]